MNQGYTYTERIQKASLLLDYLCSQYDHSTRAQWEERLRDGELSVDGEILEQDQLLRPGQRLSWCRPPWEEPEVPQFERILYEDEVLIAVDKPSGLPTAPAGGFLEHTLLMQLRKQVPGAVPMHRLGRATSGIVLFTRTEATAALVQRAWREGQVQKRYCALLDGVPPWEQRHITQPIGPVPHPLLGSVFAASPVGKPASTDVLSIDKSRDKARAEIEIHTGRPHQIRIHMAAEGYPLWGDPLYGPGGLPTSAALPGDPGYYLHARTLRLLHPTRREPLYLYCEAPF
jgi:23S rRNA pseudouridine1911/1915/1917 synthase